MLFSGKGELRTRILAERYLICPLARPAVARVLTGQGFVGRLPYRERDACAIARRRLRQSFWHGGILGQFRSWCPRHGRHRPPFPHGQRQCGYPSEERPAEEDVNDGNRRGIWGMAPVGDKGWQKINGQYNENYDGEGNRYGGAIPPRRPRPRSR